jgi:hypothetical protein
LSCVEIDPAGELSEKLPSRSSRTWPSVAMAERSSLTLLLLAR